MIENSQIYICFFFQAEDGIRDYKVTGVQTCALPISTGLPPAGSNGIGTLTTVESSAFSRYNGYTIGLKRVLDPNFQFQLNYTLSFDKSDDDNERNPSTFRYAKANNLAPEYNWNDRDKRHRFNGWALVKLPADIFMDNRVSYYSAQPISASCGPWSGKLFAPPAGQRATGPADRICGPSGATVVTRNTLRKDNAYFSWDVRFSRPFPIGARSQVEALVEIFNLTGKDNFRDPSYGNLVFNFDGTIRSGLGDPRQVQAGGRWVFWKEGKRREREGRGGRGREEVASPIVFVVHQSRGLIGTR